MADDFGKAMEQVKELLSNEKMADTLKMFMNMMGNSGNNKDQRSGESMSAESGNDQQQTSLPVSQIVPATPPVAAPVQRMNAGSSQIDALVKIQQVYTKLASNDDPTINLLLALRPHLNTKRAPMLENAINIIKLTKLPSILNEVNRQ